MVEDEPTEWMYGYRAAAPRTVTNPEGVMDETAQQLMTKLSLPVVGFLEAEIERLRTQLRASEAHCRRYAVACGMFRAAAHEGLAVVRLVIQGDTLNDDAATSIHEDMLQDIEKGDELIDPVATEVVS